MRHDLSHTDLQEISSAIENSLKMTSIETKISLLESLLSRFNTNFLDTNTCRIYVDKHLLFKNTCSISKPTFFYQDYILLTDEIIEKNYKVEIEKNRIVEYFPFYVFKEIQTQKRAYLLYAVITNELIRLQKQKKGKWTGKVYIPTEDSAPLTFSQEQEDSIIDIYRKYWKFGVNNITNLQFVTMVSNSNLSPLYVSKQRKRTLCVIRELCELLGDAWGEKTSFNTTNGEKDLKAIKKNYYQF